MKVGAADKLHLETGWATSRESSCWPPNRNKKASYHATTLEFNGRSLYVPSWNQSLIHRLEKNQFNAGLPQCNMNLKVDFRTKQGPKNEVTSLNYSRLFRRLNTLSSKPAKQIDHDEIIDFLRLCQNSDLTPAFAKIDKTKHKKWRGSSDHFARNVIGKNFVKNPRRTSLKRINEIYSEIRQNISSFHYLCVGKDGVAT